MKKDIRFLPVKDVYVAVVKDGELWKVYLLNRNRKKLTNIMVTSKGYEKADKGDQKTSTLRHAIPELDPGEYAMIEPIDPQVFHLNNEFWVSYFIDKQVYDKKYIFVPDAIREENLSYIQELDLKGVLHR